MTILKMVHSVTQFFTFKISHCFADVITFTAIRKGRPSVCRFARNSEMLGSVVCRSCIEPHTNMTVQIQSILNPPKQTVGFTVAGFTTLTKTQQIFVGITYTELYLNHTITHKN